MDGYEFKLIPASKKPIDVSAIVKRYERMVIRQAMVRLTLLVPEK